MSVLDLRSALAMRGEPAVMGLAPSPGERGANGGVGRGFLGGPPNKVIRPSHLSTAGEFPGGSMLRPMCPKQIGRSAVRAEVWRTGAGTAE